MNTIHMPATCNEGWGFWGSMGGYAAIAWPLAMTAIADATGEDFDSIRAFLDSRHGRHFADDVHNALYEGRALPDAIAAATKQWMGWKIGKRNSRDYGIPSHLPYLTGFVVHCGIIEEQEAVGS
jgi:hypothetical protein